MSVLVTVDSDVTESTTEVNRCSNIKVLQNQCSKLEATFDSFGGRLTLSTAFPVFEL